MQKLVRDQNFALIELILIVCSGAVWMMYPEWGIWVTLIALLPLELRIALNEFRFRPVDVLVIVYIVTAFAGYWAAYDQPTAWIKLWLIVTAGLLYFSLIGQPKENLAWICGFIFLIGIGVSLYYFLTYDFVAAPRKLEFVNQLGQLIMSVRPQTSWTPVHPNYVAGMIAITVPFVLYPVRNIQDRDKSAKYLVYALVIVSLALAGFALIMATSRGAVLAIVSGAGAWLLWKLIDRDGVRNRIKSEAVFQILLFLYLSLVIIFLFLGPARSGSVVSDSYYGNGSRAELFVRSLYLLQDYPITGGGLGSFPGLYSRYLLDIPYFYVPNSHNLFLDVGIEQGMLGGLSFLALYLLSVWVISKNIAKRRGEPLLNWIILFALIVVLIHGMVDDYLYNGIGSMLSLLLVGLSMNADKSESEVSFSRLVIRTAGIIAMICAIFAAAGFRKIQATWYANLGAVQLSKVELNGFPNTGWSGKEIVPLLGDSEASLHSALLLAPSNRTANHRLGLISMLKGDFSSAVENLETAHALAPNHRGIVKPLVYTYIWLGDMEKVQFLLPQIPETADELDVYTRWWLAQGRSDLSEKATFALKTLAKAYHP